VGDRSPSGEYVTVRVAESVGTYYRVLSGDLAAPPLDSLVFAVSPTDLESLWGMISSIGFFELDPVNVSETLDGFSAQILVVANADSHFVESQNVAIAGFDDLIYAINEVTPGERDLAYDGSGPFSFVVQDVCDQLGKQPPPIPRKQVSRPEAGSQGYLSDMAKMGHLADLAHPGTIVGCPMSLRDAVAQGRAVVRAKGDYYGDQIAILVDNTDTLKCESVNVKLYLDLWGPGASPSVAAGIEEAIEQTWGDMVTSDGKPFDVDVITHISADATTAPGTPGFHQIKIVADDTTRSFVAGVFDGTGAETGIWVALGANKEEIWAHEAGHLMGLDDQYEEYIKQKDASALKDSQWKRDGDGKAFSSTELAAEVHDRLHSFSGLTRIQIVQGLDKPSRKQYLISKSGNRRNLMARLDGVVQQSDIDFIASRAGLIVEVRPGDILVNTDSTEQNFAIARSEDVFAPAGGQKYLGGLWVACIDAAKAAPLEGREFDVAPRLSEWTGIESAFFLQELLDYVDGQEGFCDFSSQDAIWRITDNQNIGWEPVETFLMEAGISLGDRELDFPRMTNPVAEDSTTEVVIPHELFASEISSPHDPVGLGESVTVTSLVHSAGVDVETAVSWTLDAPEGSSSVLTSEASDSASFTTDVRGFYQVQSRAQVLAPTTDTLTFDSDALIVAADSRTETFEGNVLDSGAPFFWSTGGERPWTVTDGEHFSGSRSVVSGAVGDDGRTVLVATFNQVEPGQLSFALKVSSEACCDYLQFYVDGDDVGYWSGDVDWTVFSVELAAGEHSVAWEYWKDLSDSEGADRAWIDDVFFPVGAVFTGIDQTEADVLPEKFTLSQNYPNPFNPTTTISYDLPKSANVTLTVFDVLGRQIRELALGTKPAGTYKVSLRAAGIAAGVYFYRLQAGDYVETRRMVMVR
jgi:hypothetical protein